MNRMILTGRKDVLLEALADLDPWPYIGLLLRLGLSLHGLTSLSDRECIQSLR
jgi:hypothetical protein